MISTAFIKIWGHTVGAVAWDSLTQMASFEYDPEFLSFGWDLAPIHMPISNGPQVYSFPELRAPRKSNHDTFKGLPGLLADVLPDDYGSQLIDIWLAQQGREANSMNPVEKLCFIGNRGVGALEFEPTVSGKQKSSYAIEIDSLVEMTQRMLGKRAAFNVALQGNERKTMMDILKIGTSAGGARPKAVISYNEKTDEIRSGQANAPKGFEHWLIKLDGVSDVQLGASLGYGRIEMAYYLMAKDCGINMMHSRLLEENGRAHFMTKRFDRTPDNKKHHVQSWCAIQHYDFNNILSYSYEQLFRTLRILKLNYQDVEQLFRRMTFNVIARNCDDHTKNFSFRLKRDEGWALSPAYDICHAYRPNSYWVNQHALSINGKRQDFLKADLLSVAQSMNIRNAKSIISEIQSVVLDWPKYANRVSVDPVQINAINETILRLS